MTMQFGRDERTGQLGYWDGRQFVPLQTTTTKEAVQGATGQRIDIDSSKPMSAEDKRLLAEFQKSTAGLPEVTAPLPGERASALGAVRAEQLGERGITAPEATLTKAGERYIGDVKKSFTEPAGKPDTFKSILENLNTLGEAAPAAGGTAATGLLMKLAGRAPGFLGRRVVGAAGAGGGQYLAEKAGIVEPGGALGAAVIGGIAGIPKGARVPLSEAEKSGLRTSASGPIARKEAQLHKEAVKGFERAEIGPDITVSKQMTQPLDDILIHEKSRAKPLRKLGQSLTPEESKRKQIFDSLQAYRDSLDDHLSEFIKSTPEVPIPQQAGGLMAKLRRMVGAPERTQIPEIPASEKVIPSATPRTLQPSGIAPATLADTPQSIAPGKTTTGVKSTQRQLAAANVIEDIQAIGRLAEEAKKVAPEFAVKIRKGLGEIRQLIPGYDEYASQYAKSKGYGEAKEIIRTKADPANQVRNLLEGERLHTFTLKEKQSIIRAAEKAEGMGPVLSVMLRSPVGQQFVKMGIRPDGTISNSAINLGLQFMRVRQAEQE